MVPKVQQTRMLLIGKALDHREVFTVQTLLILLVKILRYLGDE